MLRRTKQQLRELNLLRAAWVRLRSSVSARRADRDGVLFLFYHDMQASERPAFGRQLSQFENFGDIIDIDTAIQIALTGGGGRHICLTFDDGRDGAVKHGLPLLAERGLSAAFFVVTGWIDASKPGVITWDDCRALAKAGMQVGSHSVTHSRLSGLDHGAVQAELFDSRIRIESELGISCEHFACPWGQPKADFQPDRDPQLALAAGYRSFFTTLPSRAHSPASPYLLPRVRMEPGWGEAEIRYAFCR